MAVADVRGEGRREGKICDSFTRSLPQGMYGVVLHNEEADKLLHYVSRTK